MLEERTPLTEMFPTDDCFIYTESIAPVKFADNAQNDEVLISPLTWIAFELVCLMLHACRSISDRRDPLSPHTRFKCGGTPVLCWASQ